MTVKRLLRWSILLITLFLVVCFAISWYAAVRVRVIMEPFVADASDLDISVDILNGSFDMNDVELRVPAGMYAQAPVLRGRVDSFSVSGISVYRLLFTSTFAMEEVRMRAGKFQVVVEPGDTLTSTKESDREKKERTILVDRFDLQFTSIACSSIGTDTARYSLDSLMLAGSGFNLDLNGEDPFPHFANSSITISGFHVEHSSGYALGVERTTVEDNGAALLATNIAFAPTMDLKKFGTTLDLERDVFDLKFDSVALAGFDLERWYATKVLHARSVHITNGEVIVLRDKTLPDGPQPYRPLLGTLIRKLPVGSGADTVLLSNWSATYHERADRDRGFATFPFTSLNATATGVRNSKAEPMVLDADCDVFGKTPVTMHLTADLQDSTDRFVVDARMGSLYFPDLNMATSPLVDVRATAGRLRSLVFHMEANDWRAHGTVAMHYSGIKLTGGRIEKDRTISKLLSAVINAVVRNDSKGAGGKERVGSFAIDRRRDRAIFNYLWTGLREGSKGMLLPKAFTK